MNTGLGWFGILRLGFVQASLGAVVVLATSTMNRVMVVELALPAMLPGVLVALHYAVQITRPHLGYGSDVGRRRTPWMIGGVGVLAAGGILAAVAIAWMATNVAAGIALAVPAFLMIGLGVGAAGTSLLVVLAKQVDARRRPAAATITWVTMIVGFIITASMAGHFLEPYSHARLVTVTAAVGLIALAVTCLAMWGLERTPAGGGPQDDGARRASFRLALAEVWAEPQARRFTIFVFVSMLAYSAQDLILEPFAGAIFGLTPGESTQLAGVQHGGVLLGMVLAGVLGTSVGRTPRGPMHFWVLLGCCGSAAALALLAAASLFGPLLPLRFMVFALGTGNGIFAVAAIGSMMTLVDAGRSSREGVRMGLWGAAQAIAFGLGGLSGTVASDGARHLLGSAEPAYATVFAGEALLFLFSAFLATRVMPRASRASRSGGIEPLGSTPSTSAVP
jgi:MFS transporter, BCD family, chlorophyll transporter